MEITLLRPLTNEFPKMFITTCHLLARAKNFAGMYFIPCKCRASDLEGGSDTFFYKQGVRLTLLNAPGCVTKQ